MVKCYERGSGRAVVKMRCERFHGSLCSYYLLGDLDDCGAARLGVGRSRPQNKAIEDESSLFRVQCLGFRGVGLESGMVIRRSTVNRRLCTTARAFTTPVQPLSLSLSLSLSIFVSPFSSFCTLKMHS